MAPQKPPPAVWIISGVVLLEGMAVLAACGYLLWGLFTQTPASYGAAVVLTGLCLVIGVALIVVAIQQFRGMRWTRAAIMVWQLVMLSLAVPTLTGGVTVGWVFLALPVLVLILLFTPKAVAFSTGTEPPVAH